MEQEISKDRERAIRFAVRSLGWLEIAEDDLTPERSSKAVNKCIVDLSLGRNDLLDVVGRWGDVSEASKKLHKRIRVKQMKMCFDLQNEILIF